ncbi:hypothetical protein MTO96_019812 [Rhipicephalus appendiculatus]
MLESCRASLPSESRIPRLKSHVQTPEPLEQTPVLVHSLTAAERANHDRAVQVNSVADDLLVPAVVLRERLQDLLPQERRAGRVARETRLHYVAHGDSDRLVLDDGVVAAGVVGTRVLEARLLVEQRLDRHEHRLDTVLRRVP